MRRLYDIPFIVTLTAESWEDAQREAKILAAGLGSEEGLNISAVLTYELDHHGQRTLQLHPLAESVIAEGEIVTLRANEEEGWNEEKAEVVGYDSLLPGYSVRVLPEFRGLGDGDGLREVTEDQILELDGQE